MRPTREVKDRRYSKHHRIMRSHKKGVKDRRNVVVVRADHHQAFHLLFRNSYPHQIAEILNKTWIDPNYQFIVVRRENDGTGR